MITGNALVIAPEFPYPPNHGGRVGILNRILSLHSLGLEVTLVCSSGYSVSEEDFSHLSTFCYAIEIYERNQSITSHFFAEPYQTTSRNLAKRIAVHGTLADTYNFVFVEGHYVTRMASELFKKMDAETVFFRAHNNEPKYFVELSRAEENPLKKAYYLVESAKLLYLEKKIFSWKHLFHNVLHVSYDECELYKEKYPQQNHIFFPANFDTSKFKTLSNPGSNQVVFVGSLFMPNNIDGIEWYLKEIHPKLLDELRDYSFVIAGNIKGVDPNLLNKFKSYDRCEVIESPVSLDDIYRNGKVFVNPMRFGAGVKMKTLDAIINGLPVVTTTIGAEGLGLTPDKNILQSDNSRGFADAIGRLCLDTTKRNALWNSAREFLLQTYNSKTNLIQLLNNKGIY